MGIPYKNNIDKCTIISRELILPLVNKRLLWCNGEGLELKSLGDMTINNKAI